MDMNKRTLAVGGILLAALVLFAVWEWARPSLGEDNGEAPPDMAVHAGTIVRATLHRYVTAYGTVEPAPAENGKSGGGAVISAPVGGILTGIDCAEGRTVAKGDVLFRLDDRLAQVTLLRARQELADAQKTYDRQTQLIKADGTSQKSLQEAQQHLNATQSDLTAAETQLSLLRIPSPIAGTVIRLNAKLGQSVDPNAALCEIVDAARITAAIRVPSREAVPLKPGQPVELGPGASASGTVTLVGTDVDPSTDTVLVRVSLPAGGAFQPGQFLTVRILCEEHRDCLAVPEAAVVPDAAGGTLLVLIEGDRTFRTPVQTGLHDAGFIEVQGVGLKEGLAIVTEDAYAVPSDTKIHILKTIP
jgi:membrane fusion protein (multidrug efflux system)